MFKFHLSLKNYFNSAKSESKKLLALPLADWKSFHARVSNTTEALFDASNLLYKEVLRYVESHSKDHEELDKQIQKAFKEMEEINKRMKKMEQKKVMSPIKPIKREK